MLRLAVLAALLVVVSPSGAAKVGEPAFTLELDGTEKTAKPQEAVSFTATITSRSTEPLRLMFQLVANEGRLRPVQPTDVMLAAEGDPQSQITIPFMMQTPYENGRLDETGTVKYRVVPTDPETKEALASGHDVTLTVRTVGTYVPAPQFFGVFVALGLAALVFGRRASR